MQNLIEFIKVKDPDKVSVGLASSLDTVAELELLQVLSVTMIAFVQANVCSRAKISTITSMYLVYF